MASFGIYTAAIAAGGYTTTAVGITENWDGSSWTEVNDLNTARNGLRGAGQSTSTDGLVFGGAGSPRLALTETWDGSSWTEKSDLNTGVRYLAGSGNASSALAIGGDSVPGEATTAVEEWTAPATSTVTFTTS